MKVLLKVRGGGKDILITDERSECSYGIPVAVVEGKAYGKNEALPIYGADDALNFLFEAAATTVAVAARQNPLTEEQIAFVSKFWYV